MLVTEPFGNFVKHYSDQGMMIRQSETEFLYPEAIDVMPCPFTYEETDISIEEYENRSEPSMMEILDILLGGSE